MTPAAAIIRAALGDEVRALRRAARLFASNRTTTTTKDLDDEDSEVALDHDDHQGEG